MPASVLACSLLILVALQLVAVGGWLVWRRRQEPSVSLANEASEWMPAVASSTAKATLPRFQRQGTLGRAQYGAKPKKEAPIDRSVQKDEVKAALEPPRDDAVCKGEVKMVKAALEPPRDDAVCGAPAGNLENTTASSFTMRGEVANLINEMYKAVDIRDYTAILSVCKQDLLKTECFADVSKTTLSSTSGASTMTEAKQQDRFFRHYLEQAWLQINVKALQKSGDGLSDALKRAAQTVAELEIIDAAQRDELMRENAMHQKQLQDIQQQQIAPTLKEAQEKLAENIAFLKNRMDPATEKLALRDVKVHGDDGETRGTQLMMICPK